MNEGMEGPRIVPLKCEECGGEFAEDRGGVCAGCGRRLCSRHLILHWAKDKHPPDARGPFCGTCRGDQLQRDEKR